MAYGEVTRVDGVTRFKQIHRGSEGYDPTQPGFEIPTCWMCGNAVEGRTIMWHSALDTGEHLVRLWLHPRCAVHACAALMQDVNTWMRVTGEIGVGPDD